jgi:type I restriction enzyme, R subunit
MARAPLAEWVAQPMQLRARLKELPALDEARLWKVQAEAIRNLEQSFGRADPRALIQMATGSGKIFTAVNAFSFRPSKLGKHLVAQLLDREEIGNQLRVEVVRRFHLSEGVAYDGLKHQQLALLG